jgi:hypothetical protein
VPVHIRPGDTVISGSVVEEGRLLIAVDRGGSETSLARISRSSSSPCAAGPKPRPRARNWPTSSCP